MATQIVRRLYFYSAAFIGLQLFAWGLRSMLALLLDNFWPAALGAAEAGAERLSFSVPLLAVGLPLWAFHWVVAQRSLARPEEQYSTLRRLYCYAVLLVAALGALFAARTLLRVILGAETSAPGSTAAAAIAALLVDGAVWVYHWRVLASDRDVVERDGGQATLRRWYLVLVLAFGLGMASYSAAGLISRLLQLVLEREIGTQPGVQSAVASLIAGFALWLPHHLWGSHLLRAATPVRPSEARSTLRQVYAALVITAASVAALGAAAVLLQEVLLAAFGGSAWGDVLVDHTLAIGSLLVAVPVWLYHRGQLAQEARLSEVAARGDTARRVIGYLSSAVGLGALYFGVAGLLGTLLSLAFAPNAIGDNPWREQLSWYLAASIVSLPVYALASRSMEHLARGDAVEQRTPARRIFLYIALLFGIVVTVGGAVLFLRQLLALALDGSEAGSAAQAARYFANAAIGALIAWYHVVLLRQTGAPAPTEGTGRTIAILAQDPFGAALAAAVKRELPAADIRHVDAAALSAALSGADSLVLTLDAALDAQPAQALRAFDGRKLLLPLATGYEVVGRRERDEALLRAAVQLLRASPPAPPGDEAAAEAAPATT